MPAATGDGTGLDRAAEWKRPVTGQLTERCVTGPALDGPGNSLRQQQPPRDNIAVPSVDDDFLVLVEQIAFVNSQCYCAQGTLLGTTISQDRINPTSQDTCRVGR